MEVLAVGEPVVADEVQAAAEQLAAGSEVLERRVRRLAEELLQIVRVVPAREVRGDDRSGARAGYVRPVRPPAIGELEQCADERDALDASALKDPVCLVHCSLPVPGNGRRPPPTVARMGRSGKMPST